MYPVSRRIGAASSSTPATVLSRPVAGDCELCEAAPMTPWHHEDDICWVADCESCDVPMVVWKHHAIDPPPDVHAHMLEALGRVADARWGEGSCASTASAARSPTTSTPTHAATPGPGPGTGLGSAKAKAQVRSPGGLRRSMVAGRGLRAVKASLRRRRGAPAGLDCPGPVVERSWATDCVLMVRPTLL